MLQQVITDVSTVGWHCSVMAVDGRLTYRQRPIPGRSARGGGPRWYARSAAVFDAWTTPAPSAPKTDPIFSPIAANLRARAQTYREKGYERMAEDLEREAVDAEQLATMGLVEDRPRRAKRVTPAVARPPRPASLDVPTSPDHDDEDENDDADQEEIDQAPREDENDDEVLEADGQPAPPRRSPSRPASTYKPGTRVEAKPAVVTGAVPWWARVKPGDSMTEAAKAEQDRMSSSKQAHKVTGRVND